MKNRIGEFVVNVNVNRDKLIDELPKLLSDVKELHDLVPEWSSLEADELAQNIFDRISGLISVKSEI